jgi:hypothetical protein
MGVNLFMVESICFTPFSDQFFVTSIITSLLFGIQYAIINKYYYKEGAEYYTKTATFGLVWIVLMFIMTYSTRRTLMQFFSSKA